MDLKEAIEYIRNDEAYVAAQKEADNYESLRSAARSALEFMEKWFGDNAKTFPVIAELRSALSPQDNKESK